MLDSDRGITGHANEMSRDRQTVVQPIGNWDMGWKCFPGSSGVALGFSTGMFDGSTQLAGSTLGGGSRPLRCEAKKYISHNGRYTHFNSVPYFTTWMIDMLQSALWAHDTPVTEERTEGTSQMVADCSLVFDWLRQTSG